MHHRYLQKKRLAPTQRKAMQRLLHTLSERYNASQSLVLVSLLATIVVVLHFCLFQRDIDTLVGPNKIYGVNPSGQGHNTQTCIDTLISFMHFIQFHKRKPSGQGHNTQTYFDKLTRPDFLSVGNSIEMSLSSGKVPNGIPNLVCNEKGMCIRFR
jgi:hypothetical protein